MQEVVHKSFALRLRHGVPIQAARGGQSAHVPLAFAGCGLSPLVAFGRKVHQHALLALRRQLFHQLHHLLVG